MKKLSSFLQSAFLTTVVVGAGTFSLSLEAKAALIDCKVILCLAGGFPSGCGDAKSYMIDRITSRPPKPPFDVCNFANGDEYNAHRTNAGFIHRGPNAYYCEAPSKLFYRRDEEDSGFSERAFCYTSITTRRQYAGEGDYETVTIYNGRTSAQRVNYQVQITVEPGTESEYKSSLFKINTRDGFVAEIPNN